MFLSGCSRGESIFLPNPASRDHPHSPSHNSTSSFKASNVTALCSFFYCQSQPTPKGKHCSDFYHLQLDWPVLELYISGTYSIFALCIASVSLHNIFEAHLCCTCISCSFFFLVEKRYIPLYEYTRICLYILFFDKHLHVFSRFGAIINFLVQISFGCMF